MPDRGRLQRDLRLETYRSPLPRLRRPVIRILTTKIPYDPDRFLLTDDPVLAGADRCRFAIKIPASATARVRPS